MSQPEDEDMSTHIQGSDDIQPADDTVKSAPSEKDQDGDLEERAGRLAEQDTEERKKQTYSGFILLWLAFQSTGTIYGDIGTSPLYVYSSTFTTQPSWKDLVGCLSIIIWSLTLIVTVKYVFIVLRADDDGQGGTFALYSLLARYARIAKDDPNSRSGRRLDRYLTGDMKPVSRNFRRFLETSRAAQIILQLIGVLGVSMVMSDGVLTPAQSVLGAIQGIKVASPSLTTSTIVGISCAILVCLFLIQPLGTSKIGTSFAPIVTIWLLFNLCSGIYNLARHDYTVLKAFSPYFAFSYLVRNGSAGWKSLGGLLLAFTGVEALFADLGAFSMRAIQLSWLCLAYPCLLLAYIGQAAFISDDHTGLAYTNPFFNTVPPGSFYFSLVIAVLAAIVASQAMITSSFQLLTQIMRLSYFPHVQVIHTSKRFHEQIYIPLANWLLMIGTVIVTAVYNNTTSLGNAYGVCVISVTFMTTCMVSIVALIIWRINFIIVLVFFLLFGSLDGVYMSSVLTKVPDGAWFTLMLAVILSTICVLWRFGKEQQWKAEAEDCLDMADLLEIDSNGQIALTPAFGGARIYDASGLGIFFDKVGEKLPVVFTQYVRKLKSRPTVLVFFHMRPLSRPTVPLAERFLISRTSIPSCYRMTLRHGYADDVLTPRLNREIYEQLILYVTRDHRAMRRARSENYPSGIQAELDALHAAQEEQAVYVVGKEVMKVGRRRSVAGFLRWLVLTIFLWIRETTRAKLADFDIDANNLIEVGFVKHI